MEKKTYLTPATEVLEFMDEAELLAGTQFDPNKQINVDTGGGGDNEDVEPMF